MCSLLVVSYGPVTYNGIGKVGNFERARPKFVSRRGPLVHLLPVISLTRAKRSAAVSESPSGSATRYDTIGWVSKRLG